MRQAGINIYILLMAFLFSGMARAQFYQGSTVEFGKNRVQYRDFDWFYYPGEHFDVYYYIGGERMANYTLRSSEKNLKEIEKFFDFEMEDRVQVLTYMKQSEFRQSNIGITNDDQYNIGGAARILGNKMFVYYESDHRKLEEQIRESLARLVFSQMMYGGDWKDMLKSNTLLSVPKWYEEGIIRYAAGTSERESEIFMRDLLSDNKFKSLNRLQGNEAALGGRAFWSYVAEVYGKDVIPNILYMSRVSRNVESGFLFVLGISMDTVTKDFIKFSRERSSKIREENIPGDPQFVLSDDATRKEIKAAMKRLGDIDVKYKKKYRYSQFKRSPDGEMVAFVTNEQGQYKIWVYTLATKKLKRIVKKEYRLDRIVDESFPVLSWHPSSQVLTYAFENRGRAFIGNYSFEENKRTEKELFRIEKVVNMDYSRDGKKIIFTGVNRGHTDLYLYQVIGNNQEQLTDDIYDDLDARFIENDQRIIFVSNRPDDTLRKEVDVDLYPLVKDVYIFDLENRSKLLERITNTSDIDERQPDEYSPKHYTFLADQFGTENRMLATVDSTISAIDTTIHYRYFTVTEGLSNFTRSPKDYQFNPQSGDYILTFFKRNRPIVYLGNRSTDAAYTMSNPVNSNGTASPTGASEKREIMEMIPDVNPNRQVDIRNYVFEDDRKNYTFEKESIRIQDAAKPLNSDTTKKDFELPKSRNYKLNFAADYVLTQVDNSFTSPFYQDYNGSPSSINPGISGLMKVGVSDLFEDYKIVGGFRLSGDLQNNDFGIAFENIRKRWDRKLSLQRQAQNILYDDNFAKLHTHNITYQFKYPFTELSSFRLSLIGRHDRVTTLSYEPLTAGRRNNNEFNLGVRAEYVFDNTISKGLNLYNGTRGKVWYERYQQPDRFDEKTDFNVVGFDVRHYQRIHRDLIFAFRLSGSTTFGAYKLVHYLGGVDNWLFQRVDNSMDIATNQNYSFQTFAGPMRGFYVNSRNGNSFLLANAEIRLPVFKYLMKKPIKSDFVENFQIVTFFDSGTAWTGKSPYADENTFNSNVVNQYPVTVTVDNNREPIIYGYGFGLRSRVLGYFVRADWSWGIDDGIVLDRVFYLSLNLDF